MKLIIDIPDNEYKYTCERTLSDRTFWDDAIRKGTPLDDVKAEIAEEICPTDNPYTGETAYTIEHSRLLDILDNIGKAEKHETCKGCLEPCIMYEPDMRACKHKVTEKGGE